MTPGPRQTTAHLIDDTALGGVTRMLDALIPALCHDRHVRIQVKPGSIVAPSMSGIDAVVMHSTVAWSKMPLLASLRARMGRRPIVIVEHSYTAALERELVTKPARFRRMLRLAYRCADRVVAVSEGQATWMRSAQLLPPSKLVVIPPVSACASLATLPLPQKRALSADNPLRLGACGRFSQQKGFEHLLEAMRRLQNIPVHLTLAGYGPGETALRPQSADLSNVEITGPFNDPAAFLGTVDAVVMPSRWEAYGLLAMEVRLAGRALIVTDVDGLPEQVRPARGYVVQPNDADALADAIKALSTRDLAAMGADARASARHHFDDSLAAWSKLLSELTQPNAVSFERPTPRYAT